MGQRRRGGLHSTVGSRPILSPARKIRLSEEVISAIKDAIRRGAIRPGQRLVETEIATQMGVSKAPVREALRQLHAEGLVVSFPQRGTFVAEVTEQDLWEIATLRATLEGLAVELAAERMDQQGLNEMEQLVDLIAASDDSGHVTERHLEFHYLPIRYCGHRRLQATLESLRSQTHTFAAFSQLLYSTADEVAGDHRAILAALRARDGALARRLIVDHILPDSARLSRLLGSTAEQVALGSRVLSAQPVGE